MPVRPLWIIFAASMSPTVTHLFPPCVGATLYWCPSYVGTTLVSVLCRYNTCVRLVSVQHSCPSCAGTTLVSVLCRYNTPVRLMSGATLVCLVSIQHSCLCRYNTRVRLVSVQLVSVLFWYNPRVRLVSVQHVCPSRQYNTCVRFTCICHESVQNLCPFRISTKHVSILSQYNACARLVSVYAYPSCVSATCVSVLH